MKILLTFDHELPLGGVKSYEQGIFDPTNKLINLANEIDTPITLFTDICSALKFQDWDPKYYTKYVDQLHFALKNKHDVQLHIHPHWMTSQFMDGEFIPSEDFSLAHFADKNSYTIEEIITLAFNKLEEICKIENSNYQCNAFRAGGYNVEPESKRILNKLYELGIRYDSSVVKGLYQNFSFSNIDYRKTPSSSYWPISKDGPLTKYSESELLELPVTSMPISISDIVERRIVKTLKDKEIRARNYNHTGKGYMMISKKQSLIDKLRNAFNPVMLTFDKNHTTVGYLEKIVNYNLKKYRSDNNELILTLISHPKSMGDYHLNIMKSFVDRLRKKHKEQISFITYQDLKKNKK